MRTSGHGVHLCGRRDITEPPAGSPAGMHRAFKILNVTS